MTVVAAAVAALLAVSILAIGTAEADTNPRGIDPRVLNEDIRRGEAGSWPDSTGPSRPDNLDARLPSAAAPEGAANATFEFRSLRVEGASALDLRELEAEWPHKPGDTASVADVFAFAAAVTRAYRAAGFILSHAVVPVQTIADGTFLIRVVEGYVDDVIVRGQLPAAVRARIQRHARPVAEERPATLSGLERALLLVRDLPGVTAEGTLSPGTALGSSRLTIDATHDPFALFVDYSNALPRTLDRDVFSLTAEGRMVGVDLVRVSASASPRRTYRSASAQARVAASPTGTELGLSVLYTRTVPQGRGLLRRLDYRGQSSEVRLFARYPLMRGRAQTLRIGGSMSRTEHRSRLLDAGRRDRLWTLSAWVNYERADASGTVTSARGTLARGLDIWGAAAGSRYGGSPEFTTLALEGRFDRALAGWAGGSVALTGRLRGQGAFSSEPLLSGAECTYGGRRFGAGFDPGTMSGEDCGMASLRLGWSTAIRVPALNTKVRASLYGELDAGVVSQRGPLQSGERRWNAATSAMSGARFVFTNGITAELETTRPLSLPHGEPDPGVQLHVGLQFRF